MTIGSANHLFHSEMDDYSSIITRTLSQMEANDCASAHASEGSAFTSLVYHFGPHNYSNHWVYDRVLSATDNLGEGHH